jgi:signal transduction histidine kinase
LKFNSELLTKKSLLRRSIIGHLLVLIVFCVSLLGNLCWQLQRNGVGEYDQYLYINARSMAAAFETMNRAPQREEVATIAEFLRTAIALSKGATQELKGREISVLRVTDKNGVEIYRTPQFETFPFAADKEGYYDIDRDGESWRSYRLTGVRHGLTVEFAESNIALDGDFSNIVQRFIFFPLLAFIPLAALITWAMSVRGLLPLRQLAQLISRRSPNDLRPVMVSTHYVETTPLVNEINTLLGKLDATLSRERAFLADAAHELRTPLAVIQAQGHVLQHSVAAEQKNTAVEELNLGIQRAARLIEKLLTTARLSAGDFSPVLTTVDITALTQERVATFSVLADKKGIEMALEAKGPVHARLDRESFLSALDNVIDNAIRYSPRDARILVEIESADHAQVRLRISDDGDGIPEALHERVFERFYRVAGNEQEGSGLGLAIVRRVMALHKGSVALSKGLGERGLCVELKLPVALAGT